MGDAYAVGVDMGGTKTLAVLYSARDGVVAEEQMATSRFAEPEASLAEVSDLVRRLLKWTDSAPDHVVGVGIGVPGLVNRERLFVDSIILPTWSLVDVERLLSEDLQTPVVVDNDATMAALGHSPDPAVGALVCLTLGTGVGAAVLIDGEPLRGPDGTAGQLGHLTVDLNGRPCTCGGYGCLNAYVSGTAIAERYLERASAALGSSSVAGKPEVTARQVGEMARTGDPLAGEVVRETAMFLGAGMASLANIFNPEILVLTGGVSAIADLLLDSSLEVVAARAFAAPARRMRVERGRFGPSTGAVGAAKSAISKA